MLRDLLTTAQLAPVVAATLDQERGAPVSRADSDERRLSLIAAEPRVARPCGRRGAQPIAPEPMAHGCRAAIELARDLADRQATGDELSELVTIQAALARVLRAIRRLQPVLAHPVRNR